MSEGIRQWNRLRSRRRFFRHALAQCAIENLERRQLLSAFSPSSRGHSLALAPMEATAQAVTPASSITSPVSGSVYNVAGWTAEGRIIAGTADDTGGPGLQQITLTIQDTTSNLYWNGRAWRSSATTVLLPLSGAPTTVTWTYGFSATLYDGHSYMILSQALDTQGTQQTTAATSSFVYDTTAPVQASGYSLTAAPSPTDTAPTLATRYTDTTSNIVAVRYALDTQSNLIASATVTPGKTVDVALAFSSSTFISLLDGTHTVWMQAQDAAGNWSSWSNGAQFQKISSGPTTTATLTGTLGTNGWYTGPVTVSLTAADTASGLTSTQYSLDGGLTWNTYAAPFTIANEGLNTLQFYSTDAAGNDGATTSQPIGIDTLAPVTTATLSGTAGNSGWYVGPVTVSLSAADAASGVGQTLYSLDGTTWTIYSAPLQISVEGLSSLQFYSIDKAGNQDATQSQTFSIDTLAPETSASLSGTMGLNNWYTGPVTIALTATDSTSGVVATQYSLDGLTWTTGDSLTLSADGSYTVYYRSVDTAGNIEAAAQQVLQIDTTAPTATTTLTGTLGTNGWYTSTVTVTLQATDASSGISATYYTLDGLTWIPYTAPFEIASQGLSTFSFYSTDTAGNAETSTTQSLQIDTIAPTVTGVYVCGSTWPKGVRNYLASHGLGSSTLGYAIPVGSGIQLKTLPWDSLNTISVVFSEDVSIDKMDLALTGILLPAYDVADSTFTYNNATHAATWVLPALITRDKLLLSLNANAASPITDAAGLRLDGEWTNPALTGTASSSIFPSGDGVPGGDFAFRFNVLPGDVNQNGAVQATDYTPIRNALNLNVTSPLYSPFADVNANGAIQATDSTAIRNNLNLGLPVGTPPPGTFSSSLLSEQADTASELFNVAWLMALSIP